MKAILGHLIDRTIKQRVTGSYPLYLLAKRVVAAFENHDVAMETNGEHWLLERIAARGPVTAIDVGANQGEWVEGLLNAAPDARVLCYEPVPATFSALQKNISSPSVDLINKALSSKPGELTINSVVDNPYLSSIYDVAFYQPGHQIEAIVIPTVTGDEEIAAHGLSRISIVKVDAEGHDLDVIEGFRDAIDAGKVDMFQFEYNHFTLAARRALRDFFLLLGEKYLICRLLPNGLEACGYHPVLDNFGQSNWVAVLREIIDASIVQHLAIKPVGGASGEALSHALKGDEDLASLLRVSSSADA